MEELDLIEEWRKEYLRLYGEEPEKLLRFTNSDIPLKSVYTPADIAELKFEEIGIPGIYPFTRGLSPLQTEAKGFASAFNCGYGLPEDTRKLMQKFINDPTTVLLMFYPDNPTYVGLDPDHPAARNLVGRVGVTICNTEDLAKLFDGVPIDRLFISTNCPATAMLALYIVYAERRGIPLDKLRGRTDNRIYTASGTHALPSFSPQGVAKIMTDVITFCIKNMPGWEVLNPGGYSTREAGGNAIQEIAIPISLVIALTERVIKAGFSADDFLSRVAWRCAIHSDFLEEIAKFRALRKVWAKIARERFGCMNPRSLKACVLGHTAGSTLTAQQPLNNIVRITAQVIAGILGGVDMFHITAYDEAISLPTKEALEVSLRCRDILFYESNLGNVSDPMGGSYCIENLTAKIEEEVYKMLEEIESKGGFFEAWEKHNWFRGELEETAYEWYEHIRKQEKIIIGVNKFIDPNEPEIPVFGYDPRVAEIAVQRVKEFRDRRDDKRFRIAIDKLRDMVKSGAELMPALIEAARADATLGEMTGVLKEVYGYGYHQ